MLRTNKKNTSQVVVTSSTTLSDEAPLRTTSISPKRHEKVKRPTRKGKKVPPKLSRQNSLWANVILNQQFRQFIKRKYQNSSLLVSVDEFEKSAPNTARSQTGQQENKEDMNKNQQENQEETNKNQQDESNALAGVNELAMWRVISWISRARASVKVKRFRAIQKQLEQDLQSQLLYSEKVVDPVSSDVDESSSESSDEGSAHEEFDDENYKSPVLIAQDDDEIPDVNSPAHRLFTREGKPPKIVAKVGFNRLNEVNPKMYTVENLYARESLATSKRVLFYILCWWSAMRKNLKTNCVSKKDYRNMLLCIYHILVPDGNDEHKWKCIEDDWNNDRNGRNSINLESFVTSIFETADIWTASSTEQEYVEFIYTLHWKVSEEAQRLDLDFIDPFVFYEFDPNDVDLLEYLKLIELRKFQQNEAKTEENNSKTKKKKISSFKKITVQDIEAQLRRLPSLKEYIRSMMKVKKAALRYATDSQRLHTVFRSFDSNNDGFISARELQQAIRLLGHHLHLDVVKVLMKSGDTNSDNKISFEEFCALFSDEIPVQSQSEVPTVLM